MTSISIRQPGYLPFLGFFKKIHTCDIFVYLDDVQYERGWDNRNKIRTNQDYQWLTVPVSSKFGKMLNEVKIVNTQNWQKKHSKTIKNNYNRAPFFKKYWPAIESILNKKWDILIDLNLNLIEYFISEFDLKTKTIKSSEMHLNSSGSQKLLDICKQLGASEYISGAKGKDYLNEKFFKNEKIKIIYENFQHPTYKQIHYDFIPNMSVIDLFFNEGDNSKKILEKAKNV